ncbi:MAG: phosphorylase [Alphaproteobacteria bacterium]|nr:phosphorylase [Alphaproteobacteria bacterium]
MLPLTTVLCTSGLAAEARIARAAGFPVVIGAGDRERTAALVEGAVQNANCLISFGIAGALAPHLRPGDVVISAEVVSADHRWVAAEGFQARAAALARQIGAFEGAVFGAPIILATEEEKRRAWRDTGALAVDLESDVVARIASQAGIPFIVARTIADTAYRELPPAALIPLSEAGTPNLARVLASVLRRPRQITTLIALARETRTALAALAGSAHALRGLAAGS